MMITARDRLVVALDVPTFQEAAALVDRLGDAVRAYKVGFQLFTAYGPFAVRFLQARGKRVFLDLKFHDIPNTVASAVASATGLSLPPHDGLDDAGAKTGAWAPLWMMTVHTQGGEAMMAAAARSARERASALKVPKPMVVGVTVLTSDASTLDTRQLVLERARSARAAGLDGVVASAREAAVVREAMGRDFVIVTPGIRFPDGEAGDQQRVETPASAVSAGASFLVVGRPIVTAPDPCAAAERFVKDMGS